MKIWALAPTADDAWLEDAIQTRWTANRPLRSIAERRSVVYISDLK